MRWIALLACSFGCGGTIGNGVDAGEASTELDAGDAASIPDAAFHSALGFYNRQGDTAFFAGLFFTTPPPNGCQTTKTGACAITTCAATGQETYANAGTLTLSIGATTTTTKPSSMNQYVADGITFAPGDVLGVSASGGDVPAFATQTITSPNKLVLSPAMPKTISTSQDLTFTWSGGDPGASVHFIVSRVDDPNAFVSCNFDAVSGSGTLPATLFASLPSTYPTATLLVEQWRTTTFGIGPLAIDLTASQGEQATVTVQ